MKPTLFLAILILAAGLLVGCGDPAPSTKLAPEQKLPDVSKMSPDQVDKMLKADHDAGRANGG
ncbi:hypothetical protein BH11ARM2_BH11ARM2_19640 [soil metagenome]